MAPETRSQDIRRIDESLEVAHQKNNSLNIRMQAHSDDLAQLKSMIKDLATQQFAMNQSLQTLTGEASSSKNIHTPQPMTHTNNPEWLGEGS